MADPCATNTGLLRHAQALARLLQHAAVLPAEACAAQDAGGRVLAQDVLAISALPAFDNAAMDGFALHGEGQTLSAGSVLAIAGTVAAGDAPPAQIAQAWEIMTGAPLPPGTDTIVPVERTERVDARHVRLLDDVRSGQHLRRQGSDMQPGEHLAQAGQRVDATVQMLLAAQGITEVQVRARPRVAILSTGKELVDDPAVALQPGQIRASNGPYLAAALEEAGACVIAHHTLGDDPADFAARLARLAPDVDLILTTGAVSAGIHDFIPAALQAAGATRLFHKTAIRPGKPLLAAQFPSGALVLGLPGNPVATAVCFRFFAVPLLRAWQGLAEERPLRARLAADCQGRTGFRQFLKARVDHDAQGQLQVQVLTGQESFRIGALLHANAWAVIDEEAGLLPAGTPIEVLPRDAGGRWHFD
ncbi:gephyrin-like molybdotransferase Glp [Pseudoxanthomonas sp.]|uniref:molybdopterin molybdotransferase MoeA n=1 Tax=Pseudoxanthomonas sp. TaxID=1871049 RepID=UPI00262945B0|nr:gephyrin-like molybdotransferase Glp [Pseudoxanthomonas sp.]WDS37746.1 MAG: molybdopterin molybdotransferase MoeA [Pseudoxanthomonas sp.]